MCAGNASGVSLWQAASPSLLVPLRVPQCCFIAMSMRARCDNRKWLSGGAAWMVYREFVIEARQPFGAYSPCNPDPTTGVFR